MKPNDYIGKYLRKKGETLKGKEVTGFSNGYLIFSDKGKIHLNTVKEKYEIIMEEENIPMDDLFKKKESNINPDAFFSEESTYKAIVNSINTPHTDTNQSEKEVELDNPDLNLLSPETRQQIKQTEHMMKENKRKADEARKKDPFLQQFIQPPEHQELPDDFKDSDVINTKDFLKKPTTGTSASVNQASQKAESRLPKMKKTKKVKIKLELNEMIPKPETIKAVQDLFEDISIVNELAAEITDKLISDRESLEGMIIAEIEKLMKPRTRKKTK